MLTTTGNELVEDEETNLQLLMFLLRQDGHEVFFAKTGEEAIEGIVAAIDVTLLELGGHVPPETRSLLKGALANTELMTRMVNTLLEVSRLEAGGVSAPPQGDRPVEYRRAGGEHTRR
ncbi:MAG TPA: hypothetical protein EYQ27_01535 [Gemmatimonadetes bacterium]|nr:hypothetical protein [Gemmatimonadota bacterium]